jgi:hypothetical protein
MLSKNLINNLYKSWSFFDLNESLYMWEFAFEEKNKLNLTSEQSKYINKAVLQDHVQRCIEGKDWQLFITNTKSYSSIEIQVDSTRFKSGGLKTDIDIAHNMLSAYLKALAAQRAIAGCQWQNFKGDVIEVVEEGFSGWPAGKQDVYFYEKRYVSFSIENQIYYANGDDFGDLVFYKHKDQNLATKKHDFLGLVDDKHPESEGLLRFTAVAK